MSFAKHTKILTVFSFMRLKSPDICWYQWKYPSLIFAAGFCFFIFGGKSWLAFDNDKMVSDVNALMGILVGFYIAALAAVSSFTNESLDQIMKGRAPTLNQVRQGQVIKEKLTRRRFLSILFGYCACISIILYIFGVLQAHISIAAPLDGWLHITNDWAHSASWAIYLWLLCSLFVVTMLGLHYLIERMHRT